MLTWQRKKPMKKIRNENETLACELRHAKATLWTLEHQHSAIVRIDRPRPPKHSPRNSSEAPVLLKHSPHQNVPKYDTKESKFGLRRIWMSRHFCYQQREVCCTKHSRSVHLRFDSHGILCGVGKVHVCSGGGAARNSCSNAFIQGAPRAYSRISGQPPNTSLRR